MRCPVLLHQYQVAPVLLDFVALQVAQLYAHGLHLHVPVVAANCATERIVEYTVTIVNITISHRVIKKTLQNKRVSIASSHILEQKALCNINNDQITQTFKA